MTSCLLTKRKAPHIIKGVKMPRLAWLGQREDFDRDETLWQSQSLVVLCSYNEIKLKSSLFSLLKFIKIIIFSTFTMSALYFYSLFFIKIKPMELYPAILCRIFCPIYLFWLLFFWQTVLSGFIHPDGHLYRVQLYDWIVIATRHYCNVNNMQSFILLKANE